MHLAKKIAIAGIGAAVLAVSLTMTFDGQQPQELPLESTMQEDEHGADVVMPTKSSRPGCEDTNSCYIPSSTTITAGQSVTWLNQDSAFHSVTSGHYDSPTGDFDSGYMDPYQTFTLTFEHVGTVDYFCTLHPWMAGQVVIQEG